MISDMLQAHLNTRTPCNKVNIELSQFPANAPLKNRADLKIFFFLN